MNCTNRANYYSIVSAPRQDNTPTVKSHGVEIIRASDVKPKKLARLWNGRFHRGKLGFIAGEPGRKVADRHLHGGYGFDRRRLANGEGTARRGDVIYISAEDSAADTIGRGLRRRVPTLTESTSSKRSRTSLGRDHSVSSSIWVGWTKSSKRSANRGW